MMLGISSYSLDREIRAGRMTLDDVIEWVAQQDGECMELVPFAFRFMDKETGAMDNAFIEKTKKHAHDAGIKLVNYSVLADLCVTDEAAFEREVERIQCEVDVAAALEIPRMRHDISAFRRPLGENGVANFDQLLPTMIEGAKRITNYAKAKGVMTLIENHGFFVNGCDRVERVINGVDDENYQLLLDTGNIVCMDEDPEVAAIRLAARAKMIHLKDFYVRRNDPGDSTQFDCGGHWFRSLAGRYLRGAILGQGDLDVPAMLSAIKGSGYDGPIVIEFEGLEEAPYATSVSLANARRIWDNC